jgi:hypothetical protein
MLVFHGSMAHVAELRLPPGRLAVKSAVGIARARMRVILDENLGSVFNLDELWAAEISMRDSFAHSLRVTNYDVPLGRG